MCTAQHQQDTHHHSRCHRLVRARAEVSLHRQRFWNFVNHPARNHTPGTAESSDADVRFHSHHQEAPAGNVKWRKTGLRLHTGDQVRDAQKRPALTARQPGVRVMRGAVLAVAGAVYELESRRVNNAVDGQQGELRGKTPTITPGFTTSIC